MSQKNNRQIEGLKKQASVHTEKIREDYKRGNDPTHHKQEVKAFVKAAWKKSDK